MIRLPNNFNRESYMYSLETTDMCDLSKIYPSYENLRPDLLEQIKNVTKLNCRFAKIISNINEDIEIKFNEVIIEIPVFIGMKKYCFPIISYVDDEYSLIRGQLLGFNKHMTSALIIDDALQSFSNDLLSFSFDIEGYSFYDNIELYPYILERNFTIDKQIKETATLKITDYKVKEQKKIILKRNSNVNIIGQKFNVLSGDKLRDTYTLNGVVRI